MNYAGNLTVDEAVQRIRNGAVLVDVRSAAEWQQVGVPLTDSLGSPAVFVEWNRNDGTRNTGFIDEIEQLNGREILFLCRSGRRSIEAAEHATAAGHTAYSVLGGFESPGGWQGRGLAWKQA